MSRDMTLVSEGQVTWIPTGGSGPWTWDDRPAGSRQGAVPVTQHPQTASAFPLRACHSCMRLKQALSGVWITGVSVVPIGQSRGHSER